MHGILNSLLHCNTGEGLIFVIFYRYCTSFSPTSVSHLANNLVQDQPSHKVLKTESRVNPKDKISHSWKKTDALTCSAVASYEEFKKSVAGPLSLFSDFAYARKTDNQDWNSTSIRQDPISRGAVKFYFYGKRYKNLVYSNRIVLLDVYKSHEIAFHYVNIETNFRVQITADRSLLPGWEHPCLRDILCNILFEL